MPICYRVYHREIGMHRACLSQHVLENACALALTSGFINIHDVFVFLSSKTRKKIAIKLSGHRPLILSSAKASNL